MYLVPAAVAAEHMRVSDAGEECVRRGVLREAGQELGAVDEVHLQQDVLIKAQDSQRRAEQGLFSITAKQIPHATCHI